MSRSGYNIDCDDDNWSAICYAGAVASAIRGKRGQAFLRELRDALDAMPEKRLAACAMEIEGEFCTLGIVAHKRGLDTTIAGDDVEWWAHSLGIADAMAREIAFENDECCYRNENPEIRWRRMRDWVEDNIKEDSCAE